MNTRCLDFTGDLFNPFLMGLELLPRMTLQHIERSKPAARVQPNGAEGSKYLRVRQWQHDHRWIHWFSDWAGTR
jgi:hypothetical protein